ncbi:hypothetical protein [Enterococcus dongliensis]|nr:hypothetical protein [Enterococcus dongliensis]MDT2674914.1 hypothetical protein [Enterococcus dongliensis]
MVRKSSSLLKKISKNERIISYFKSIGKIEKNLFVAKTLTIKQAPIIKRK